MAISLQQVQQQRQTLIMTPQMQQSIQLLQMNSQELEQLTQEELLENPFLTVDQDQDSMGEDAVEERERQERSASEEKKDSEKSDDFLAEVDKEFKAGDGDAKDSDKIGEAETRQQAEDQESENDLSKESIEEHPEQFDEVDINWGDYYDDAENKTYTREPEEEQTDFAEYTAAQKSLYDHLVWQLHLCVLEGVDYEIGEYIVGCIDPDGYLSKDCISDIVERFGVTQETAERVLGIIQEFEPVGVAARSSAECLLIQMENLGSYTDLARQVLENHFEELQRKRFKQIAKALDADEDEIIDIHQKVGRLEPKPGRAYSKESIQYIRPDIVVKIIDGEMSFFMNEGNASRLSVSRFYRQMLRLQSQALSKEEKSYAVERYRGALMLIKNIEKRKSTILRVTEAIMEVQRAFLDKGVSALKPLTLREVADMVGMHESTIARVTSKKYVETPQGLFSLKYFFSSGIESSNGRGEAVSSRVIKDKLLQLIEAEDTKKPLSDQKIAEILNKDGFSIARRTVAKYRDQLKILPAKLRREA